MCVFYVPLNNLIFVFCDGYMSDALVLSLMSIGSLHVISLIPVSSPLTKYGGDAPKVRHLILLE